jgi:dipeptide transport system ATP-binding protein
MFAPRCSIANARCHSERPRRASARAGNALCHTPLVSGRPVASEEIV